MKMTQNVHVSLDLDKSEQFVLEPKNAGRMLVHSLYFDYDFYEGFLVNRKQIRVHGHLLSKTDRPLKASGVAFAMLSDLPSNIVGKINSEVPRA